MYNGDFDLGMKHLSIIIILILVTFMVTLVTQTDTVQAHWDDDVWLENERQELRDWDNLLELEVFLALYDEPIEMVSGEELNKQCENIAFQLRDKAREWGRNLDVEILTPQEYRKYYGKYAGVHHAINKAVIGNEMWYVDWLENKVWHALNLD